MTVVVTLPSSETCECLEEQTPWCGALLEKLTVTQLLERIPAFYGTRKCIAVFT